MTEQLEKWIESWWEDEGRPESIEKGQLWTINSSQQGGPPGTIVAILSTAPEHSQVIPMHHELPARTGCDPLLEQADLGFQDAMVAAVEAAISISNRAFESARFLGLVSRDAQQKLLQAREEFQAATTALAELKKLEADMGAENVPEEAIDQAFAAGILKLVPVKTSMLEAARLRKELLENLLPFQTPSPQDQQRIENHLDEQRELRDMNEPTNFYKAMIEIVETQLSDSDEENVNGSLGGDHDAVPLNGESREDLKLLRALVYARLELWNRSEYSFRKLILSNKQDLARRGVVWINLNQNSGDKNLAQKIADEIVTSERIGSTEQLILEAGSKPLHEFIKLDSLDHEIIRIWHRVGASLKPQKK